MDNEYSRHLQVGGHYSPTNLTRLTYPAPSLRAISGASCTCSSTRATPSIRSTSSASATGAPCGSSSWSRDVTRGTRRARSSRSAFASSLPASDSPTPSSPAPQVVLWQHHAPRAARHRPARPHGALGAAVLRGRSQPTHRAADPPERCMGDPRPNHRAVRQALHRARARGEARAAHVLGAAATVHAGAPAAAAVHRANSSSTPVSARLSGSVRSMSPRALM